MQTIYPLGRGEEQSEGEYQAQYEMCNEPPEPRPKRSESKYVWTTKDGTQIRVRKMTDSHLVNAIRFLRRNAEVAQQHDISNAESLASMLSGEIASDDCDAFVDHLKNQHPAEWLDEHVPQYSTMLREARRRKLVEVQEQIEELL